MTEDHINKVVLITGGSSGLGLATAQRFAGKNFKVIITGRNIENLKNAKKMVGENCYFYNSDVSDLQAIPAFVAEVIKKFGTIDILVNNAGINQKKEFLNVTNQEFDIIVRTNQTSVFALSREVAGYMLKQQNRGVIINISSMAAQYGIPNVISYTAAKSAIDGMTRAMAVDLGPLGIRVNAVAPGFIQTPMVDKAFESDHDRRDKVISRTPLRKLGDPDDIANAIYFLASDQASFITGVILRVDGGNSIGF